MIIETKEIYKCEHCRKLYQRKHHCEKHEKMCWKNPANERLCFGCNFLRKESFEIEGEYSDSYLDLFFCDKVGHYLHTPQVEVKGNAIETDEPENLPMKTECEHFKLLSFDDLPF